LVEKLELAGLRPKANRELAAAIGEALDPSSLRSDLALELRDLGLIALTPRLDALPRAVSVRSRPALLDPPPRVLYLALHLPRAKRLELPELEAREAPVTLGRGLDLDPEKEPANDLLRVAPRPEDLDLRRDRVDLPHEEAELGRASENGAVLRDLDRRPR